MNNYQFKSIIFDNEYINKINNLITRAWKYDYGIEGFLKYDPDHFRWLVSSPDFDPELAIGAFTKKGELVGFNAVFPARFKWRAVSCKSGISTYLSIDPEHRKKGIARNLIIETINRSVKN